MVFWIDRFPVTVYCGSMAREKFPYRIMTFQEVVERLRSRDLDDVYRNSGISTIDLRSILRGESRNRRWSVLNALCQYFNEAPDRRHRTEKELRGAIIDLLHVEEVRVLASVTGISTCTLHSIKRGDQVPSPFVLKAFGLYFPEPERPLSPVPESMEDFQAALVGVSLTDVSRFTGITRAALHNIKTGKSKAMTDRVRVMLQAYPFDHK